VRRKRGSRGSDRGWLRPAAPRRDQADAPWLFSTSVMKVLFGLGR
jgi:hypothetical protein